MKRNEPETDVRHVVIRRLKDMNFIKEVRESWTIPDSELASKDWGDAEKHKRTYKVIHATKGTMEVEATTSYEAAKLFAKAKGLKSTKGVDAYLADAEHVAEDSEDGASAEDLVDIITHRIKQDNNLMLKLLGDEGPDSLMNAIENVADFYSGTTEVGSSDVSAMVDAVKKQLI
jgi:aldehyde:ferredoxin oxidoreductase